MRNKNKYLFMAAVIMLIVFVFIIYPRFFALNTNENAKHIKRTAKNFAAVHLHEQLNKPNPLHIQKEEIKKENALNNPKLNASGVVLKDMKSIELPNYSDLLTDEDIEQLKSLHERQEREIEEEANKLEEIVIPPSEDEERGITVGELKELHKRQERDMEESDQNFNEYVVAPSQGKEGLRLRELKYLHEQQERKIRLTSKDPYESVPLPDVDSEQMTLEQIKDLHREQETYVEEFYVDPNELVIPPSGDNDYGLTLGELKDLQEAQKREMIKR